jgi:hypothetical protein
MNGLFRRQGEDNLVDRYSRMLGFVFVSMDCKKLDAILFAGVLIDLSPTDAWHMNPVSLSQL